MWLCAFANIRRNERCITKTIHQGGHASCSGEASTTVQEKCSWHSTVVPSGRLRCSASISYAPRSEYGTVVCCTIYKRRVAWEITCNSFIMALTESTSWAITHWGPSRLYATTNGRQQTVQHDSNSCLSTTARIPTTTSELNDGRTKNSAASKRIVRYGWWRARGAPRCEETEDVSTTSGWLSTMIATLSHSSHQSMLLSCIFDILRSSSFSTQLDYV